MISDALNNSANDTRVVGHAKIVIAAPHSHVTAQRSRLGISRRNADNAMLVNDINPTNDSPIDWVEHAVRVIGLLLVNQALEETRVVKCMHAMTCMLAWSSRVCLLARMFCVLLHVRLNKRRSVD